MNTEERLKDAEELTNKVAAIIDKIKSIEARINVETAPLRQEIKELEDNFLDKYLKDSSGQPVRKGMVIEKDGKKFKILNRYQQCIFKYLGNARVNVLPEGKKRTIEIWHNELLEYTIVD